MESGENNVLEHRHVPCHHATQPFVFPRPAEVSIRMHSTDVELSEDSSGESGFMDEDNCPIRVNAVSI